MSGPLGALRPAVSGSVADWVFGSLHAFDEFDVGIVIPPGFDAYACLLHSGQSDDHQVRGCPRIEDIRPLVDVLRSATSTPGSCWFCIWNGWGWLHVSAGAIAQVGPERPGWRDPLVEVEQLAASTPLVGDQYRQYHLFSGSIDAVVDSSLQGMPYQAPSLWWPDDRAWLVASEIDHSWTYVGGSVSLVERVLDRWRFNGRRVRPEDPLDWNALA